jgi:hypothetical protein
MKLSGLNCLIEVSVRYFFEPWGAVKKIADALRAPLAKKVWELLLYITVHTHIHICIHIRTYIYMYTHTHIHIRIHIRTYIYMYIPWIRKCVTKTIKSGTYDKYTNIHTYYSAKRKTHFTQQYYRSYLHTEH